jgi:hypothetical protein
MITRQSAATSNGVTSTKVFCGCGRTANRAEAQRGAARCRPRLRTVKPDVQEARIDLLLRAEGWQHHQKRLELSRFFFLRFLRDRFLPRSFDPIMPSARGGNGTTAGSAEKAPATEDTDLSS